MERNQIKRRTLLGAAAGAMAAGAVNAVPAFGATPTGAQLGDYAKHTTDSRSITVTSTTGQQLRITAYGDQMVRVHAARSGETFFADTRYEMVVPANHTSMGGTLTATVSTDTIELHTAAADGLRVVLHKKPLRLEFYARATGALLAKEDATHSINWSGTNNTVVTESFAAPASGEHFLKAGHGILGRTPKIDRTGDTVSHNYADAAEAADNPNDQAPAIVPFYLSSQGYGVFFNTTFDTTFNFGGSNGYGFYADGHNAGGSAPQIDYFLINGPQFAQLLDRYTQLTGRPRLPQRSIFGLHMTDHSFPDVSDQNWWQTKITQHRAAGFPFDHQVNDNRWRNGTGGWSGSWFEFSPDRWPDPAGYERWAAANGVTVTLDYNRNNTDLMENWKAGPPPGGYSLAASDLTNVANNGSVPDWTNPATRTWVWKVFWDKALNPSLKYPCDGLWIDETDDIGAIPYTAKLADGRTWAEDRNAYILNLHKGVGGEGWDPGGSGHIGAAKRPFTWSRGAVAGQQRYGHYWTGDISSTYAEMQNQIRGMQTAGLGGFPFHNVDGGGYGDGNAVSDALYRNWAVAWSSLAPIWRPHTSATVPAKGKKASRWPLDQGATAQADFAKYGQLRYTLMPYVYTLAHQAASAGMPMARAMVIDYQSRPQAYTHDLQYMWGPSLLVAPLTSDGGAVQKIWLPAGATWYNFWADIKHTGTDSSDFSCTTSTGEPPLFVKAGAILPKYPYAQSSAYLTRQQLELEVYSGADGAFDLVEDDGVTEAYQTGRASTTHLAYTDAATRVVIANPQGTYDGAPTRRRYVVRFHGLAKAVGMRVNGGATLPAFTSEAAALLSASGSGSVWNAQTKVLSVVTPEIAVGTNGGTAATVEPSGAAFPAVSGGTVYQAESARLDSTFIVDTLHPGYTGTGYADFNGTSAGSTISWTVDVAAAGKKQLLVRYANGGSADRPVTIDVNGTKITTLDLPSTGSFGTWATASCTATLPQGATVTVRITLTQATGANIDSLTVL